MSGAPVAFAPTGDAESDELVASDPFALMLGMLLDQQISIEMAFRGPLRLRERLGSLDAAVIADREPEDLAAVFAIKPALHRFPAATSKRAQALCRHLVEVHDGNADLWSDGPTARELHRRISELPGFGDEKTMIFIAVLAKRFGVKPRGWKQFAGPFADKEPRSVADMDSEAGRDRVKAWKKLQRAEGRTKQD